MKVLLVGSGGREHAIAWKLKQSPRLEGLFCAPGNPGTAQLGQNVPLQVEDLEGLEGLARREAIDLTVVGPEAPLVAGITDHFEAEGLRVAGPSRAASALEGSKAFAKEFMRRHSIPAAGYAIYDDADEARTALEGDRFRFPVVLKADGLAAGKGVFICQDLGEGLEALATVMLEKKFGASGDRIVIEDCLVGEEASFHVFSDGTRIIPMVPSQDHKAIYEGDQGPNTGGMGAYSTDSILSPELREQILKEVIQPTVTGMAEEGTPYRGILYAGLMLTSEGPKVLEFNVRFGDPETQVILTRMESDLLEVLSALADHNLEGVKVRWSDQAAVCVVLAAGGYPGSYQTGQEISGLEMAGEPGEHRRLPGRYPHGKRPHRNQRRPGAGRYLPGAHPRKCRHECLRGCQQNCTSTGCTADGTSPQRESPSWKGTEMGEAKVAILMGSKSDREVMGEAAKILKEFGVSYEMKVLSAHRTPRETVQFVEESEGRGVQAFIAGAGFAAHLAGTLAAHSTLPIIGVPLDASSLKGLDSLLSTVQMPKGIPVACMGIGKSGAINAGLFAVQLLALTDPNLAAKMKDYRARMREEILSTRLE